MGYNTLFEGVVTSDNRFPTTTTITDGTNSSQAVAVNADGQMHVVLTGTVDTGNSSSDTLAPGGVFTGEAFDTLDYGYIFVSVYADVASATDGLSVEISSNGVNWDNTDNYTIPAAAGKTYSFQPGAKYFRVVYTNGGTIQAAFRLQTIMKKTSSLASSHRIQDIIIDEDDAELVKAVITGKNAAGAFVNFQATTAGNFKISLEEFETGFFNTPLPVTDPTLEISRGQLTGITHINKYGRAPDGIQLTITDIWDRSDAAATQQIWVAPTVARIHNITSTSTADDGTPEGAGAGAQAVRVWGLTSWGASEVSEDVILNGTANVPTSNAYVIIHRKKTIPVGTTYNVNTGIITATAQTDGTITAQINAGTGQTNMAIYGIPSTQTAYITNYVDNAHNTGNPSTNVESDFEMLVAERPDLNPSAFTNKSNAGIIADGTIYINRRYNPYKVVAGPAIIKFQAVATLADTEGSVEFDLILVDN